MNKPEGWDGTDPKLVKAKWDATQWMAIGVVGLCVIAPPVGLAVVLVLIWRHILKNWDQ